jgi:hypothetical protein
VLMKHIRQQDVHASMYHLQVSHQAFRNDPPLGIKGDKLAW